MEDVDFHVVLFGPMFRSYVQFGKYFATKLTKISSLAHLNLRLAPLQHFVLNSPGESSLYPTNQLIMSGISGVVVVAQCNELRGHRERHPAHTDNGPVFTRTLA